MNRVRGLVLTSGCEGAAAKWLPSHPAWFKSKMVVSLASGRVWLLHTCTPIKRQVPRIERRIPFTAAGGIRRKGQEWVTPRKPEINICLLWLYMVWKLRSCKWCKCGAWSPNTQNVTSVCCCLAIKLEGASLLKGARNVYYLPQVEKQLIVTRLHFQPGMLQVGMHEGLWKEI